MKCLGCRKQFKRTSNNQKYCSYQCRNSQPHYKEYRKKWQRWNWRNNLLQRYSEDELIQCKFCGKYFRQIGSHVVQTHKYESAREYREEYGLDVKKGILPEDYRQKKARQAIECGGAKNLKKGSIYWFKKGDTAIGRYKRSKQTLERLKSLHKKRKNVNL